MLIRILKNPWLWGALLVMAAVGVWWKYRVPPAEPTEFVESFTFVGADGKNLTEPFSWTAGQGFESLLTVTPRSPVPQMYEGRKVWPSTDWSAVIVFSRRGSGHSASAHLLHMMYVNSQGERTMRPARETSVKSGTSVIPTDLPNQWFKANGYDEKVPSPLAASSRNLGDERFWTWMSLPVEVPGEFVMEVILFPTAAWDNPRKFSTGQRVVLHRQVVTVHPQENSK